MLLSFRVSWYPVVALTVLGITGLAAVAAADPIEPSKIRTIRVAPQPANDFGDPSMAPPKYNSLHVLKVRPRLPDEHRDAAGRMSPATTERRFAPEALDPPQAAPQ